MVEIAQLLQDLDLVPEYLHSPQKNLTMIPFVSIVAYPMQDEDSLWLHLSHTLISSETTAIRFTSSPEACFFQVSALPIHPISQLWGSQNKAKRSHL